MTDYSKEMDENAFAEHVGDVLIHCFTGKRKKNISGVPTGYRVLDRFIGGLRSGQLVVISSCPAVGKSALVTSLAANMAFGEVQVPIGFFPLETGGPSLVEHMIACKADVPLVKLRNKELNPEEYNRAMAEVTDMCSLVHNVIIRDSLRISPHTLCREIREMVGNSGVKVVFINGVGLIRKVERRMPRSQWFAEVFRRLKLLARELGITIICSCHLNIIDSTNRCPHIGDIEYSDMIMNYPDIVLLIDNPAMRFAAEEVDPSVSDIRKVIVAKNNEGRTGGFLMRLNPESCRFEEVGP